MAKSFLGHNLRTRIFWVMWFAWNDRESDLPVLNFALKKASCCHSTLLIKPHNITNTKSENSLTAVIQEKTDVTNGQTNLNSYDLWQSNITTGPGVMPIYFYMGLTRNQKYPHLTFAQQLMETGPSLRHAIKGKTQQNHVLECQTAETVYKIKRS